MNIDVDGSLEKWLRQQLTARGHGLTGRRLLLDVGAYHGDFAATYLSVPESGFDRAILFEPNPANFNFLGQQFAGRPEFQVEQLACDTTEGDRTFFCSGETYTGSLLRYDRVTTAPVVETVVHSVRLDDFLRAKNLLDQVGLLKIDTQGNELRVLQGAPETLRTSRPWIVCELLHLPRFKSQAQPHEIAQHLSQQGYTMAAQFNEHYTQNGWLAWSDACFVPVESIGTVVESFQLRPTAESARRPRMRVGQRIRRKIRKMFHHGSD